LGSARGDESEKRGRQTVSERKMNLNYIAAFFALLSLIFLILSATGTALLAGRVWRRIGIIFGAVAVVLFFTRPQ